MNKKDKTAIIETFRIHFILKPERMKKMNIQECYREFEGNYEEAKARLQSDALIQRFAVKFLSDTSYESLDQALKEKNYEVAFRSAHTLKGVSLNLGFGHLGDSASALTEHLRNYENQEIDDSVSMSLFEQVSKDYHKVVDAVHKLS